MAKSGKGEATLLNDTVVGDTNNAQGRVPSRCTKNV